MEASAMTAVPFKALARSKTTEKFPALADKGELKRTKTDKVIASVGYFRLKVAIKKRCNLTETSDFADLEKEKTPPFAPARFRCTVQP
jgi:hypothetical protein